MCKIAYACCVYAVARQLVSSSLLQNLLSQLCRVFEGKKLKMLEKVIVAFVWAESDRECHSAIWTQAGRFWVHLKDGLSLQFIDAGVYLLRPEQRDFAGHSVSNFYFTRHSYRTTVLRVAKI